MCALMLLSMAAASQAGGHSAQTPCGLVKWSWGDNEFCNMAGGQLCPVT